MNRCEICEDPAVDGRRCAACRQAMAFAPITPREAVARIIDPIAVGWKEPWRRKIGFYTDENAPYRQAEIERDEDREREEIWRRRAVAYTKADAILATFADDLAALRRYRAATHYVGADSWDGCPDCVERLRWATEADPSREMTPDEVAHVLRGYEGRAPSHLAAIAPDSPALTALKLAAVEYDEAMENIARDGADRMFDADNALCVAARAFTKDPNP